MPSAVAPLLAQTPLAQRVVDLTVELVKIPSITAIVPEYYAASVQALDVLQQRAEAVGATCHRMVFEGGDPECGYPVDNLYIEMDFGQPQTHLCYMGHVDVVGVGDESQWSEPPFAANQRNGYIYGRGTTDMKGSVAAFMTAFEDAAGALTPAANLRLSMLVTADEEWGAVNGSRKVLEWLKAQGRTPQLFLVGEPSSQDRLGTHIKIGRRGSLCGRLLVNGVQGHAAYTSQFKNPNRGLALAMSILTAQKWDDGNENYPATNFEIIATQSGDFNASAIVPAAAGALWNVRYTPDHTAESLAAHIQNRLANPPAWALSHPDIDALKDVTVVANIDTVSTPYRSTPARLTQALKAAVKTTLNIDADLDASGGTTDGRFVHACFPHAEVVEFGPPERGGIAGSTVPSDYLTRGGMHQTDERIAIADLQNLARVYVQTITQLAQEA